MKTKIQFKSLMLGVAVGVLAVFALGAGTDQLFWSQFFPVRFRVVGITRHGEAGDGKQTTVLRLKPHYGKIEQHDLEFRLKHDTQDLTIVTLIEDGYDIRTNDIIGFGVYQHIKTDR